jgi:[ribosomal protein S5]-alanine N-acetyltransferase
MLQPPDCVLRTKRLIVRLARPGDADAIAAFYAGDKEHQRQYSPVYDAMFDALFWRDRIEQARIEFDAGRSCQTFLFELDDHTVIGSATLSNIVRGLFHAAYLGYVIAGTHEGRGLMFEALEALVGYAFDELNLHRIMANYQPGNARSQAVLERLGFVTEGLAPKYLFIDGAWRDHILTALTNKAWRASP